MHVAMPARACALFVLAALALYAQHVTGDAQTAASPSAAAGCMDGDFGTESAFVTAAPGDTTQFVVAFANTGTCAWIVGSGTQVDLGQGPSLGNPSPLSCWLLNPLSSTAYATTTTSVVAPGQLGWFIYNVRVPNGAPPDTYAFRGELVSHATGAALRPVGYHQDLTVAQGSSAAIGGRVTRRATGAAVSGVSVQVHDTALTIPYVVTTDACGYYSVRPTNATYRINYIPASSSLFQQWWTTSLTYDVATSVTVSTISTQILDVALSDTFSISGTVRDSTGAAVGGVTVVGWDASVACCWSFNYTSTAVTGAFTLAVPAGSFKLQFDPPPGPLATEFYVNEDVLVNAAPIQVSSASPTPTVNFRFRPTISGTVTSMTTAQAWVQLFANCTSGVVINQRVVNLPLPSGSPTRSGSYAIPLSGPSGGASVLVRFAQSTSGIPAEQWYQGKTSCATATPIIWNNLNITGVDGQLP